MTREKPYGMWPSDLSARALAGDLSLKDVGWAADGALVWLESRDGRGVLVTRPAPSSDLPSHASRDITTAQRVTGGVGYGGGEFTVAGQDVFFAADDGRLYRTAIAHGPARTLTPAHGGVAAPCVSPDGRWVIYVHTDQHTDTLAAVDTQGAFWPQKLAAGADFYMQPAWAPDSRAIAWISWDHPNMPWDQTQLHLGQVEEVSGKLSLTSSQRIAADSGAALMQPEFSPDGKYLAYLSDEDGWWQLYLYDLARAESRQLTRGSFEIGGPAWIQGTRAYVWKPDASGLLAIRNQHAQMELISVDLHGNFEAVEAFKSYQYLAQPAISPTGELALLASSSRIPPRVVTWDGRTDSHPCIERHASAERLVPAQLADMKPVRWPCRTSSGDQSVTEIHGNYYPPTHTDYHSSGLPPVIISIHGGPTAQSLANYAPANQFFATRGFAVLEVNYRGSTGYGRAYRHALRGQWGVYDVEDAVSAAHFLIDQGLADPTRIIISGGSAGGYTVLQALVEHPGTFAAGICRYGISDLFALSMETHKFESHYNDQLVGVLPADAAILRARSPRFHADKIQDPLAIFQGGRDKVVPPNQAEMMVQVLQARGVPHEYHLYPDEGHGWRRAETIEAYYQTALTFLHQHVLFA